MSSAEFRAWMQRHGLTEPAAAQLLGVSKKTIARWKRDGADRIVALACWAIDYGAA